MVPFPARRADDPEPLQPDTPSPDQIQPQIEELASRLEAQGFQSAELVLDLVLHDLADEARQAVGATGAAIALERNGELVCRAAAGSTVPDLGVRIHTESGLSGICVKEGSTQVCTDTECDDRVDAEACRRLGVRSIVVIPLFSAERIIGIFEVFSARPKAFSAEEVKNLEPMAATAAQTVKATRQKAAPSAETRSDPQAEGTSGPPPALSVDSIMEKVTPMDPAVRVLRWLVIGLAIPLLVLIGFDLGWRRVAPPVPSVGAPSHEEQVPESQKATEIQQSVSSGSSLSTVPANVAAKARGRDDLSSRGGLVIYQNGRVIYHEVPRGRGKQPAPPRGQLESNNSAPGASPGSEQASGGAEGSSVSALPPGVTGGRLLQSVRPQYPPEAIRDKREGAVLLHGTVAENGAMQDLKVVSGDPILSQAALAAVQQWKYEPYRRNGKPINMPIDISIDFNLPKQ
ncbi:MAG TPA: TonB family protein [Terriglobales bacterium]|nr:TonB family protein [Terriglobales bacterium]